MHNPPILRIVHPHNGHFASAQDIDAFTGEPITRSKATHPYNYQPYEVFTSGQKGTHTVWSDHLISRDIDKFANACEAVWGNRGQTFEKRSPSEICKFLRIYLDDPTIDLHRIVDSCNVSGGYSVWAFTFSSRQMGTSAQKRCA